MRLHLLGMALVLFGMAMSTTSVLAQSQILINLTNQVWKYQEPVGGADPGAFWDPLYDDSGWSEGRGVFAFENSTGVAALNNNVYPYTNTVLRQPSAGGPTVVYFRTHFNFSGGNPDNYSLVSSNLIDDSFVMYLNGVEISRFNMSTANDDYVTGLAATANPNGEGVYVFTNRLIIPLGTLVNGDNVLAVRVHQNSSTSSDVVWGTWLHASLGYRPRILSPTSQVNIALEQFRSTNLTVTVDAAPPASLQWFKDNVAIPGATTASFAINNMDSTQAGTYQLRATNPLGTSNSPNFVVTYVQDNTAPSLTAAVGDLNDLTLITVVFSEDVIGDITEPFSYYIQDVDAPENVTAAQSTQYGSSSNIVTMVLPFPRDPARRYDLVVQAFGTITDRAGNPLADTVSTRLTVPLQFQEGVNGYVGTLDTEVRFSAPTSAAGGQAATVNCDTSDGTPAGEVHSMVRFENAIGGGAGQIPIGSSIISATLRIWTDDLGSSPTRVMRMLVPWDENSTWDSLGSGINQIGVEAVQINTLNSSDEGTPRFFDDVDVTSTVQAWANGEPNYGFAFLPAGTDGWRWVTSENTSTTERPRLTVAFAVTPTPCLIQTQPVASTNVNEKAPFTLAVVSRGSDLTYQWFKNNNPIANATNTSYSVARAVPTDSGTYKVVVHNGIGPDCTSANSVVNVIADNTPPALTAAIGNPDQTTISLTFNDTLEAATAGSAANYSLSGGIGISGVALNGNTVTLTSSVPRVVGQNYTLTITGVRDDAVAHNVISPNPTVTNLAQQFRAMPFNTVWKYETNGLDLGTAWKESVYDDSTWPSGTALLGLETTAATLTTLAAQGLNTNNAMSWQLTRPDGTPNITWYLRTTINIPYNLAGATVALRDVVDDGSVYYFNGVETERFNMPAGAVTYLTEAVNAPGEGVIRTTTLTNVSCGQNVVAVSLHNDAPTSTDILFAAELLVTVPSFTPCTTGGATLSIVNNGNGTVTLSWTGSGTLQQSTDLTNWTPAANQANPQTFAPVGLKFYRVQ